jgi:hypothetical protein
MDSHRDRSITCPFGILWYLLGFEKQSNSHTTAKEADKVQKKAKPERNKSSVEVITLVRLSL